MSGPPNDALVIIFIGINFSLILTGPPVLIKLPSVIRMILVAVLVVKHLDVVQGLMQFVVRTYSTVAPKATLVILKKEAVSRWR